VLYLCYKVRTKTIISKKLWGKVPYPALSKPDTPLALFLKTPERKSSVEKMQMKSPCSVAVVMLMMGVLFSPLFAQQQEIAIC